LYILDFSPDVNYLSLPASRHSYAGFVEARRIEALRALSRQKGQRVFFESRDENSKPSVQRMFSKRGNV
jgi:hypothetical protein